MSKLWVFLILVFSYFLCCEKNFEPISNYSDQVIVYGGFKKPHGPNGLYISDLGISEPYKVSEFGDDPVFSPDGKKIVFYGIKGSKSLYLLNLLSKEYRKLTVVEGTNSFIISDAQWSYDNQKIAYSSGKNGGHNIFIYDLENNIDKKLTSVDFAIIPVWSYDNLKIACYKLLNNGEYKIAVISTTGSNYLVLDLPGIVSPPFWLPDGRIICNIRPYSQQSNINYKDVIITNVTSTDTIQLTNDHNSAFFKVYDEDEVIIFSNEGDFINLDIINVYTKYRRTWFTLEKDKARMCKISPDNQWIAFMMIDVDTYPESLLYIKRVGDNNEILLSEYVNPVSYFDWSKLRRNFYFNSSK